VEGSFIVNSKYKFVEVVAARVAKQQPALPRLAPGAGWMARQAKRTGRQVKVCRARSRYAERLGGTTRRRASMRSYKKATPTRKRLL
jgi:hypothetical protein